MQTAPIRGAISAMRSAPGAARRALLRQACADAARPKRWPASMPGINRSIGCGAGSRKSLAHGSEAMVFAACGRLGLTKAAVQ